MKTIIGRVLIFLGFAIFFLTIWLAFNLQGSIDAFILLSQTNVIYLTPNLLIVFLFSTAMGADAIGFLMEKKYTLTRWILFVIVLAILGLMIFTLLENWNRSGGFGPKVFTGLVSLISIILIVLTFAIKKKAWTKWVLMAGSSFFFLFFCALGIFLHLDTLDYRRWNKTIAVLESKTENGVHIMAQVKETENKRTRFLQTKRKYLIAHQFEKIDPLTIPAKDWMVLDSTYAKQLKVITKVEDEPKFLEKAKAGFSGTLSLQNHFEFHDNIVFENLERVVIESGIKDTEAEFLFPSRITFKNCKHLDLRNLKFESEVFFENCESIVVKGCEFGGDVEEALFFNDACDGITVMKCSFSNSIVSGINAPNNSLFVNNCHYYNTREYNPVGYDKITIRGYKFDKNLSRFYKTMLCENGTYMFSNVGKGVEITDECRRSEYVDPLEYGTTYSLFQTLKEELSNIEFTRSQITMLKMISGGINPYSSVPEKDVELWDGNFLPNFSYVNPTFVRWWKENMLPEPQQRIGLRSAEQLYEHLFVLDIRLFAETYLKLNYTMAINEAANDYISLLAEHNRSQEWVPIIDRFHDKYHFQPQTVAYTISDSNVGEEEVRQKSNLVGQMTAFWIRRYLDGSDKELFSLLEVVLTKYDPDYWEFINEQYPDMQ